MARMKNNDAALDAFLARKAEIDTAIAALRAASDDHFNVSPDVVHWGHVGDLSYIANALNNLVLFSKREAV